MVNALLICTYNEPSRTAMYEDVIRWWIQQNKPTKEFDIYVVDSFGEPFCKDIEEATKTVHFKQKNEFVNSSVLELQSLRVALDTFTDFSQSSCYEYVIKLTGKYTLPELKTVFQTIQQQPFDILTQNKDGTANHRHCEIVVYKSTLFSEMVDKLFEKVTMNQWILERALFDILTEYNVGMLPDLKNESNYKRAVGDYMSHL